MSTYIVVWTKFTIGKFPAKILSSCVFEIFHALEGAVSDALTKYLRANYSSLTTLH